MKFFVALTLLAASVSAKAGAITKVPLSVYVESGCPNCQDLILGDLNATLTAEGVADILDLSTFVFGNAYYVQEECPNYPSYDRGDGLTCWDEKCGVVSPPAECFSPSSNLVCQHGSNECAGNALELCAMNIAPDFVAYMPFIYCIEANYPASTSVTKSCAASTGLDYAALADCLADADLVDAITREVAYETALAKIPGTPQVVLNGVAINDTFLLKQVCAEFSKINAGATMPAGCSKFDENVVAA